MRHTGDELAWTAEMVAAGRESAPRITGPASETITIPRRSFWHTMWAFYVAEYKAIVGR
jgi:hypothetical protein